MATKDLITKVWIIDGCIVCDACETASADVFEVLEDTCIVRPEALTAEFTKPRTEDITEAAEECPVDVIKFDVVTVEVAEDEAAPQEAEASAASPAATESAPSEPSEAKAAEPSTTPSPSVPSPAAPTPAAEPKPAETKTSPAKVAAGVDPDPAIQALLKAANARGGNQGILRAAADTPEALEAWRDKNPKDLPPEARQALIMEAAKKAKDHPNMDRRAMLSGAALTVGWVSFGTGVGVSVGPAFARFMMPNVLEEPDPRVRVGKLQRYLEMEPGDVIEDFKPQGIWMIRDGERLAALSIICTHLGCIPNWIPNDRKFKCPCHGSVYRPNGINFEGPTPRPLERFRLLVEDGILVVDKSKKYHQELGQWDQPGSYIEV